ncbi:cytochrome P450 4F6-like [Sycon ciliatum]|uniref:cytochrome P450 4F6-like n=1 Tax=Sycon ciliatum TaxID=27933 RepID=UPI0031F5F72A
MSNYLKFLPVAGLAGLSFLLARLLHIVVRWWLRRRYLKQRVPEPCKPHWIRGHLAADDRLARNEYIGYARKLPRMLLQQMGPFISSVALSHPDTIAQVMKVNPPKNELVAKLAKTWLGNGLVFTKGERWERDHRLLSKAFSIEMRREYMRAFKEATSITLDIWEELQAGASVNMAEFLPMLTFDIILRCAMGAETTCQTNSDPRTPARRYGAASKEIGDIIFQRLKQPWLYFDFIFLNSATGARFKNLLAETHEFSDRLISEQRALLEQGKDNEGKTSQLDQKRHRDMLDVLLTVRDEDGVGYSDSDIREHVETFLFAGHDTTSSVLEWAIHYLCHNKPVQERCRREVMDVLEKCSGLDNFAHEHLAELQYLSQTIQETLRIASVGPVAMKTSDRVCKIDGVQFPAGTDFQINIIGVHHNEQVWTDPDTFKPDRFSPDQGTRSSYAFIPFSCGPRTCIGKHFAMDEMKVVLSMILSRFRLLPDPDSPETKSTMGIFVKPDPPVHVLLDAL